MQSPEIVVLRCFIWVVPSSLPLCHKRYGVYVCGSSVFRFFVRKPRITYLLTDLLSSYTTPPPFLLVAKQMQVVTQDIEKNVSAPVAEVIAPAERATATADETETKSSCRSVCLRLVLALPLLALGVASLFISAYLFTVRLVGFPSRFIPYPCDPECGFLAMYNTIRKSSFVDGLCTFVFWPGAMQTDRDVCNGPFGCLWDSATTFAGYVP